MFGGGGGGEHCSFKTLNDIHQMKLIMACMQNNIDAISIYCLHEMYNNKQTLSFTVSVHNIMIRTKWLRMTQTLQFQIEALLILGLKRQNICLRFPYV